MNQPIYTQEQMLNIRNENYFAGIRDARKNIIEMLESEKWRDEPMFQFVIDLINGEEE
jgi:hypothetical protein